MGNTEKLMNQIKITARGLQRQAKKCEKDEKNEKVKVKKKIKKGNMDGARIYAENAIRKRNEQMNYLQLSSRLDAVVACLDTQAKMTTVSKSMGSIVKSLESALSTGSLQKMSETMDKFERKFVNMEVPAEFMESSMAGSTSLSTPEGEVNSLMQQVADDYGLEVSVGMPKAAGHSVPVKNNADNVDEDVPSERLADLINRGDWYILEKSKRVKPFRCGEYDERIAKVKDTAASTGKKAVKYARREGATLHALEIERARESKDSLNFSAGTNKQDGDQGDVDRSLGHLKPDEQTQDTSAESSIFEDNSILLHELSQSGVSFEEPKHINPSMEQSAQGQRRKTPNDSEDDGTQGTKRMRGLEDRVVGRVSSSKRKRTQVARVHEFLKKKSRRRVLSKVLESSTMINVRVTCEKHSMPTESSLPGVSDSKVSGLESNESKRSLSSVINNNSDSIGVSCEDDTSQNATLVIVEAALSKSKQKGSKISSMPVLIENDPSNRLFDVSFMREENHPAGVSSVLFSSASRRYVQVGAGEQSSQSSQIETLSVGNEVINESGFTSSGAVDINNISHNSIEKVTSKWQLKGKRNSRHKSKSKIKELRKFVDMDIDYDSNTCMVGSGQKVNHNTVVGQVIEIEADELRGWSIGHISYKVSSEGLAPQRLLPFRQSRFTINPKYQMSDFSFRSYEPGTLYDVDLEVKTSYRPQGVPYISLMSKLNGKPIIGHPLAIEVLDDGFLSNAVECYNSVCQLDGVHLGGKRKASSSKGVDVVCEVKPSNIRFSAKHSRASPSTSRKSGLLSKKIRKLSSLTGSQKLHEEEEKKICMEKLKASSVACVPLKVVFSRINAALTHRVSAG